jgi:hypothetical protein
MHFQSGLNTVRTLTNHLAMYLIGKETPAGEGKKVKTQGFVSYLESSLFIMN